MFNADLELYTYLDNNALIELYKIVLISYVKNFNLLFSTLFP